MPIVIDHLLIWLFDQIGHDGHHKYGDQNDDPQDQILDLEQILIGFDHSLSSSSVSSPWIERQEIPEVKKGNVYRGISEPVIAAEKNNTGINATERKTNSNLRGIFFLMKPPY